MTTPTGRLLHLEIDVDADGRLSINGPDLFASRNLYDYVLGELGRMLALEYGKRARLDASGLVVVPGGLPRS